jgi:hypothetical protein
MYVPEKHFHDFGPKNIALIALVAVVLGALAWSQRPIRSVAIEHGTGINANLAVNNAGGKVLGASEYNQALIEQFAPIEVKTSPNNSYQAFVNYTEQVNVVKEADGLELLLNGNALQRSKDGSDKFIADLKKIAVPSVLEDYHKLLLAYYQLRFTQQDSLNSDDVGVYVSAVGNQLDVLRTNYQKSAGVMLP